MDPNYVPTVTPEALANAFRAAADRLAPAPPAQPSAPSDWPKRFSVPMVQAVTAAAFASDVFQWIIDEAGFIGSLLDAVGAMTAPPTGPADVETLFTAALAAYGQPDLASGLDYDAAWASLSASFATMPAWAR